MNHEHQRENARYCDALFGGNALLTSKPMTTLVKKFSQLSLSSS